MKWQSWALIWLTHVLCWPLIWNSTTTKNWEEIYILCFLENSKDLTEWSPHLAGAKASQAASFRSALKFGNHPSPLPASIWPLHTLTSCLPFRLLNFWHLIIPEKRFRKSKQRKWLKYCEVYNGLRLCVTEDPGHLPPLPSTCFLSPEQEVPDPLGLCLSCR